MAYEKINWADHVVQKPRTYLEARNADGSVTFTEYPGEIIQDGTPLSADNFNHMEDGIVQAAEDAAAASELAQGMESRIDGNGHTQAASTVTAGTLGGRVQAQQAAQNTLANAQVRDITIGSTDLTAGVSALNTGTLYFYYV